MCNAKNHTGVLVLAAKRIANEAISKPEQNKPCEPSAEDKWLKDHGGKLYRDANGMWNYETFTSGDIGCYGGSKEEAIRCAMKKEDKPL